MGVLRFDHPPHLPPVESAPILQRYDPETKKVEQEYILEAPIDERGVVDIFKTVELALSLVDDTYLWPRDSPRPDIHHFVWERSRYHPRHYNGSLIPRDYRDKIAFHKGYLPRQLHDFIHATIAPPPVPSFDVMEGRVKDYELAVRLFESARGAVTARRKPGKISGVPSCKETGEILLGEEILAQIMLNFEGNFEATKTGLQPGNEFIDYAHVTKQPPETVARLLGRVAGCSAVNLMPLVYGNKQSAKVA
jgi:hypothetical protein